MSCTRKGSGHMRLDSLCTYTVENLEFLDTPLATYPPTCGAIIFGVRSISF